jgi:hypothetical protein
MARRLVNQPVSNRDEVPDLQTQFEALLDTVWRSERMWKLQDRIEAQIRKEEAAAPVDNGPRR